MITTLFHAEDRLDGGLVALGDLEFRVGGGVVKPATSGWAPRVPTWLCGRAPSPEGNGRLHRPPRDSKKELEPGWGAGRQGSQRDTTEGTKAPTLR